jgi:predicted Zn-dependent peptidase
MLLYFLDIALIMTEDHSDVLLYESRKMPNGATLLAQHRLGAGLALSIRARYGFAYERLPQQAHLAEHLSLNKGEPADFLQASDDMEVIATGSTNAQTYYCDISFGEFEFVPGKSATIDGVIYFRKPSDLFPFSSKFAKLLYSTDIRPEVFNDEIRAITKEQRQQDRSKSDQFEREMFDRLWGEGHPYTRIYDPSVDKIKDLQVVDVQEAFEYIKGKHLTVALVGDFGEEHLKCVEENFGTHGSSITLPDITAPRLPETERRVHKKWRGEGTSRITFLYRLPETSNADYPVMSIIDSYLAKNLLSSMRTDAQLCYTVNTAVTGLNNGSVMELDIVGLDESEEHAHQLRNSNAEHLIDRIKDVIEKLRRGNVEVSEITRARNRAYYWVTKFYSAPYAAATFTDHFVLGKLPPYEFYNAIAQTSTDDAVRVAHEYLVNPVIGLTLPKKQKKDKKKDRSTGTVES